MEKQKARVSRRRTLTVETPAAVTGCGGGGGIGGLMSGCVQGFDVAERTQQSAKQIPVKGDHGV